MNSNSLPEAGPIRRILALGYDTLMVIAICLVYVLLVSFAAIAFTSLTVGDSVEIYDRLWYRLGFIVVNAAFFIYFWHRGGQTIGMRAWRLKLVDSQSSGLPSIKQCLLRCVLAPVAILFAGCGYWWCWFDKEGRAAHDRLTHTRVLLLPKIKKR